MHYDIFNGDADGIISLIQLRLANPIASTLITGVKRDIALVEKVRARSIDSFTILDISMAKNQPALNAILECGADVFYADHHQSGGIPKHSNLNANIDLDANTCTALIVDQILAGQYHLWAITAAYGDNLMAKAETLANEFGLSEKEKVQLNELGMLINYNGYGASVEELHYHPAELYNLLKAYTSPIQVINDLASPYYKLKQAYQSDITQALMSTHTRGAVGELNGGLIPDYQSDTLKLYKLNDGIASRRVSGVLGNSLANQHPSSAHAVLTQNKDGGYTVSLRAPLNNKQGASSVCSQFATGGGREAAAGINILPEEELALFIKAVEAKWG